VVACLIGTIKKLAEILFQKKLASVEKNYHYKFDSINLFNLTHTLWEIQNGPSSLQETKSKG